MGKDTCYCSKCQKKASLKAEKKFVAKNASYADLYVSALQAGDLDSCASMLAQHGAPLADALAVKLNNTSTIFQAGKDNFTCVKEHLEQARYTRDAKTVGQKVVHSTTVDNVVKPVLDHHRHPHQHDHHTTINVDHNQHHVHNLTWAHQHQHDHHHQHQPYVHERHFYHHTSEVNEAHQHQHQHAHRHVTLPEKRDVVHADNAYCPPALPACPSGYKKVDGGACGAYHSKGTGIGAKVVQFLAKGDIQSADMVIKGCGGDKCKLQEVYDHATHHYGRIYDNDDRFDCVLKKQHAPTYSRDEKVVHYEHHYDVPHVHQHKILVEHEHPHFHEHHKIENHGHHHHHHHAQNVQWVHQHNHVNYHQPTVQEVHVRDHEHKVQRQDVHVDVDKVSNVQLDEKRAVQQHQVADNFKYRFECPNNEC